MRVYLAFLLQKILSKHFKPQDIACTKLFKNCDIFGSSAICFLKIKTDERKKSAGDNLT